MSWGCPSICLCMHALYAGMVAFCNWFAVDFSLICVNLPNTGDFNVQQQQTPFYGHCTGQPVLASTSS